MLSLLLCFPIGLALLWTHPTYTTKTKGIVTGVMVALAALGALANSGGDDEDDVRTSAADAEEDDEDARSPETSGRTPTTVPTTTTEPPTTTTTIPTTTAPLLESVTIGAGGQQATEPFRLDGGDYIVHYRFDADCFYGASLESTDPDAFVYEDVGTGDGPLEGDTNIYGLGSGEYYVDMISGPAPECPWEIVLTERD